MGPVPHVSEAAFGQAVSAKLREAYPHHTAKQIAGALRCTIKAAENILNGHLSARSITRLTVAYGPLFIADAAAAVVGSNLRQIIIDQAEGARLERAKWEAEERLYESAAQALGVRRAGSRRLGGPKS